MRQNYIGKICPYCKTPLTKEDTVVICSVCDMPHHLSCWQENQGCTTFGCTGSIREIIGNDAGAVAAPAQPAPMPAQPAPMPVQPTPMPVQPAPMPAPVPAEQAEKPIEVLHESRELVIMEGVPLAMENMSLILDRNRDKLFARCTFRSLADQMIKAVLIEIVCQDVWGSTLGEPVAFQYLDLKTKRDSLFGQTEPVELSDRNTRRVQISVKKVLMADDTVLSGGGVALKMPAPVLLREHLGSDALAAEYARETSPKAQFVVEEAGQYWRCACGCVNNEEKCHHCGCTKEQLLAALDPETLNANMVRFAQAQRAAAEKAQAERAERIRLAEEQVLEEQRRQKKWMEFQQQLEQKKKKKKTVLAVMLTAVALLLVLGCVTVFFGIPYYQYQTAMQAYEEEQYDEAYAIFVELGDFMDSATMALESRYRKAGAAMEAGQYSNAIEIFESLGDYRNSATMIQECNYLWAQQYKNDKDFEQAYRMLQELGDYRDSKQLLDAIVLEWAQWVFTQSSTSECKNFVKTVKLSTDQYYDYYNLLVKQLQVHNDIEYWYSLWITSQGEIMGHMLTALPSIYQDVSELSRLFGLFEEGWNYDVIFRENSRLVKDLWSYSFVQSLAEDDNALGYFLEGYWTGSGYYLNFYENEDDGGTYSSFDLPWVAKPYGTKYYDLENMIYYWEAEDGKQLAKVYRFEIVSYDCIRVYCYKNNRTYTLYR